MTESLTVHSFESRVEHREGKKDKVSLKIGLASEVARRINKEDLIDHVNSAAKVNAKPTKTISTQIVIQS